MLESKLNRIYLKNHICLIVYWFSSNNHTCLKKILVIAPYEELQMLKKMAVLVPFEETHMSNNIIVLLKELHMLKRISLLVIF
jgi:hypothetical protein